MQPICSFIRLALLACYDNSISVVSENSHPGIAMMPRRVRQSANVPIQTLLDLCICNSACGICGRGSRPADDSEATERYRTLAGGRQQRQARRQVEHHSKMQPSGRDTVAAGATTADVCEKCWLSTRTSPFWGWRFAEFSRGGRRLGGWDCSRPGEWQGIQRQDLVGRRRSAPPAWLHRVHAFWPFGDVEANPISIGLGVQQVAE